MASRALNVVITGDAKGLGVAARRADTHMDSLGKSGVKMGKMMAGGFAVAGAAAAGALVVGLKKSIDAAMEAEKSQARMVAQLKASGVSYRAHSGEIDKVIQKHSKLAGVDDEDLQDAFTNIVRATGDVNVAMKDMALVTDLARAKNIDVAKAGEMVAKVHAGNTGVLKRMGIAFQPVTEAQDKLKASGEKYTDMQMKAAKATDKQATSQDALAQLQRRFAGQAEAYGKTAAGAQERFGVAVENLQEKIGAKLLPIVADVTNGIANFVGQMESGEGAGGRFAANVAEGFDKVKTVAGPVVSAIREFVGEMRSGEGAGGEFAARVSEAFETVKRVIGDAIADVKVWLRDHRGDIDSLVDAFKTVARFAKRVFEDTLVPVIKNALDAVKPIISGVVSTVRGLIRTVSGLLSGDWDKAWSGMKEAVRGAFRVVKTLVSTAMENMAEYIKDFGPKIVKGIVRGLSNMGKALATGIFEGIKWAAKNLPGMAADALKGLGSAIGKQITGAIGNIFGDGLGRSIGDGVGRAASMFPAFGGGLMGARPNMAPVAGAASRFGLGITSGRRAAGSLTSSGNVSYHSTGEALDIAGPAAGMLGFFRFMKNTMGSRLAELIYTPGGAGIKNGGSHTYSGKVAADHFDHVHVAIDSGVPGVGDGIGQIKSLWTQAGGKASAQNIAAAVAMAESSGNPSASNRNSDGSIDRGLWQINSVHGALSTFDRLGNARAAVRLSGNGSNWRPWVAYTNGNYRQFLGAAGSTGATSGGSGGSGPARTVTYTANAPGGLGSSPQGTIFAGASGSKYTPPPNLIGPGQGGLAQRLADIGLDKAHANDDAKKLIPLLYKEAVLKANRLKKVKAALKRRLSAATRQRLTDEATQLVQDLDAISVLMFDLTGGQAGVSSEGVVGSPEVAAGIAADAAAAATKDVDPGPTPGDFYTAAIARARLTEDTADDIVAATAYRDFLKDEMDKALADADPRNDEAAINAWISARDAVKTLTESVDESNRIQQARDALWQQIADNQLKIIALTNQGPAIVAAVVAAVSGGIGGQVGLGSQTPGYAGGVASYGTGRL